MSNILRDRYESVINDIVHLKDKGFSNRNISLAIFGNKTQESTVRGYYKRYLSELDEENDNDVYIEHGDKLHILGLEKQVQRLQDINTNLRREKRENYRDVNALESIYEGFVEELEKHKFTPPNRIYKNINLDNSKLHGVIQLSDLHFGERVEYEGETYHDINIASARLKKFADICIERFKSSNIQKVTIAITGDLINSDRRLDEITANSNSRARTTLEAVNILQQFIHYVSEYFVVHVASVIGNESRLNKDVGWSNFTGSDNFDYIIHEILSKLFEEYNHVKFVPMEDLFECLLNIDGFNLLLTHGNNKLASKNPESEVQKLKGRYSDYGHKVDYVIFGHIHSTLINDSFGRSASIVGGNGYSAKALNLSSTAAQNIYIINTDEMSISGCNINLNRYDENNSFIVDNSSNRIKRTYERSDLSPYVIK